MQLNIKGKTAIVCASSRGLGRACAFALAKEGVNLVINGRTQETLDQTAEEIRQIANVTVTAVVADVTTTEGREQLLAACPSPDILVNNAGGPPPGDFRDWDETDWNAAVQANMLTPIMLIKAVVDGMIDRKFGRIVNITSAAVKSPIPALGLSNGARAGLTGFAAGLARQTVAHNVTINGLLPGPFNTDRIETLIAASATAQNISHQQARQNMENANPARRLGNPEEFGAMCAFLCSDFAGYMSGQNIVMDGGTFPGIL